MAACAISTAYAQDVSTAKWTMQPVTIDGAAEEWHQPLNFYDSETKLLFAISNDSANIYLCFEAKDNMTQMKIMRGGMRVELDTKGRNGKSASIDFPLPPKEREEMGEGDNSHPGSEGGDTSMHGGFGSGIRGAEMWHQRFLTNNITMELKGFASLNGIVPVRGRDISVAMNWDDAANLFYEIKIPISQLLDDGYTADNVLKEITLHAEVFGIKGAGGSSGNGGGFNGRSGRGGFGGSGGMRGGGMRGGRGMRGGGMRGGALGAAYSGNGMGEKTSFKQKFVLGSAGAQ